MILHRRGHLLTVIILLLVILPLFNKPESSVCASEASNDWPILQHDPAHTGYSLTKAPNASGILWESGFTVFRNSPLLENGRVFIGAENGVLFCLDWLTGTTIRSNVLSQKPYSREEVSTPAVSNGRVFVNFGSRLYCFGLHPRWEEYPNEITINPTFYDAKGSTIYPPPSLWAIRFPNGTLVGMPSPVTFYHVPLGTYNVSRVVWKGKDVSFSPSSILLVSNTSWSPKINCILPTDVSLALSSMTSLVGFKVTISGNLSCNDVGLSGSNILLSYSVTIGESWNEIVQTRTDSKGLYNITWIPSASGNYLVKAAWAGNNTYPSSFITQALSVIAFKNEYVFSVASNSTISDLFFNSTSGELKFAVTGPSNTTGYSRIYIAKSLVENIADLKIYFDGKQLDYVATSADDSWLLFFVYQHSTHRIVISLGMAKPFIQTSLRITIISGALIILTVMIFYAFKKLRKNRVFRNAIF